MLRVEVRVYAFFHSGMLYALHRSHVEKDPVIHPVILSFVVRFSPRQRSESHPEKSDIQGKYLQIGRCNIIWGRTKETEKCICGIDWLQIWLQSEWKTDSLSSFFDVTVTSNKNRKNDNDDGDSLRWLWLMSSDLLMKLLLCSFTE